MTPGRRALLISSAAGLGVSVLGNLPLMGIPGALALLPAEPVIQAIWDRADFPQDSAWPWAIVTTLALGPVVPLAWMLPRRLGGWRHLLAAGALLVLGAAMVAVATYAWGVAPLHGARPAPPG